MHMNACIVTRRYLLFLAAAPVAVWLVALPFLNHVPFVQKSELESEHAYFSTSAQTAEHGGCRSSVANFCPVCSAKHHIDR